MPSIYAHTRFGDQAVKALPEQLRLSVQRFRRLYNVGCSGPDFFFFYWPMFKTKLGALGSGFHRQSGKEFFENAAQLLRSNPSEGGTAYLFGVLSHYCLDSVCHPLIREVSREGNPGHVELETEFDRHLLTQDGKVPAHLQNIGFKSRLTWGECVTIASFYPPASAYTVRIGVGAMSIVYRMLAMKNRKLLQRLFKLGGEYPSQLVMYSRPNHRCQPLLEPLEQRYAEALERYSELASQLTRCLETGEPLGAEFASSFG